MLMFLPIIFKFASAVAHTVSAAGHVHAIGGVAHVHAVASRAKIRKTIWCFHSKSFKLAKKIKDDYDRLNHLKTLVNKARNRLEQEQNQRQYEQEYERFNRHAQQQSLEFIEIAKQESDVSPIVDQILEEHGGVTCPYGGTSSCSHTFKNLHGLHVHFGHMHKNRDWRRDEDKEHHH